MLEVVCVSTNRTIIFAVQTRRLHPTSPLPHTKMSMKPTQPPRLPNEIIGKIFEELLSEACAADEASFSRPCRQRLPYSSHLTSAYGQGTFTIARVSHEWLDFINSRVGRHRDHASANFAEVCTCGSHGLTRWTLTSTPWRLGDHPSSLYHE